MKYETESPLYETQKGSGVYRSLGQMLRDSGRESRIEDYSTPPEFSYLVDAFWDAKAQSGDISKPLTRDDLCGSLLDRNERGIIFDMDRAFRAELSEVRRKNDKYLASKRK